MSSANGYTYLYFNLFNSVNSWLSELHITSLTYHILYCFIFLLRKPFSVNLHKHMRYVYTLCLDREYGGYQKTKEDVTSDKRPKMAAIKFASFQYEFELLYSLSAPTAQVKSPLIRQLIVSFCAYMDLSHVFTLTNGKYSFLFISLFVWNIDNHFRIK